MIFAAYLLESSPLNTYVAYVSVTDADYGSNGEVNVKIKTKRSRDDGKLLKPTLIKKPLFQSII